MKKRLFIGVLFMGIFAACAPDWFSPEINSPLAQTPGHIYVCLVLPEEQLASAHKAIESWDHALHQWKWIVAIDGDEPPCSITVRENVTPKPDVPTAIAWVNRLGGDQIFLRRGFYEQDVTGILIHELGHALGAQHVNGTLMNPTWKPGTYICPDVYAVIQVAAYNRINLAILCWCKV